MNQSPTVKLKFHPDTPQDMRDPKGLRGTPMSSGHDLRIAYFASDASAEMAVMAPGSIVDVEFHITIDVREFFIERDDDDMHFSVAPLILPRSGLGIKGLTLSNGTGLIDADYTKPLRGRLQLASWAGPMQLLRWDRVAQLVFTPVVLPRIEVVDAIGQTSRGGFGSTGVA